MSKIIQYIVLGLLSLGFMPQLSAQNLAQDMDQMRKVYEGKSCELQYAYVLYASATSTQEVERMQGLARQKGHYSYNKLGTMETLHTPAFAFLINHDAQSMLLQPAIEMPSMPSIEMYSQLDSLADYIKDVKYELKSKYLASYTFKLQNLSYKAIRLDFDPTTFLMKKTVFFLLAGQVMTKEVKADQATRLEISFEKQSFDPSFDTQVFSLKAYLTKSEGEYSPRSPYTNYDFINYLP